MDTLSDEFKEEYDSTNTCPNLGMRGDRETRYAFSSRGHLCFGVNPPEAINLDYQEAYCLKPAHSTCIVLQKDWKGALPLEIALKFRSRPKRKWPYGIVAVVIIGIIAIFGMVTGWDGLATAGRITPITFDDLPSFSGSDRQDEMTL